MKRLLALSLFVLLILALVGPAGSQGPGLFVRTDCTTITAPVTGQTWCFDATAQLPKVWNGSAFVQAPATPPAVQRSYLAGLTLSTAGASATMTTAAGQATDSTNVDTLTLASSIAKTTAAWAVGTATGGLDTGTIANSTWYHFHVIKRTDTAVVDVLISLSATAPTMPTNYTERRRIGSGRTDGSAQWTAFTQDGDYFRWAASVLDVNITDTDIGTAAVTRTLTVPTGVNVFAIINAHSENTGTAQATYFSDLAANDEAASLTATPLGQTSSETTSGGMFTTAIRTNTSAQIRTRVSTSSATGDFYIATLGWFDRRGRDN